MTSQEIRKKYLEFFKERGHTVIPRALLVPQNDPTTLFTGSGMQPLIPYLLGQEHPEGKRLVDSQTCLRAQDIDEVGDNRHTTFFEMLGNWSLGDYFKREQLNWFWQFLIEEIKLDPSRIYVSCFIGNEDAGIPKDSESATVWSEIFAAAGLDHEQIDIGTNENGAKIGGGEHRISFYGDKNWWCRAGKASDMPDGEPGGPDSEVFYLFPEVKHNPEYGEKCHVNCDCGRYIELGNSVFMEYVKTDTGFSKLPKRNVDYGGGLERISAAAMDSPDVYKISLLWPIISKLEVLSGKNYDSYTNAMRVVADHLRGATFLAIDGVVPSNKEQGYVMRRLIRRAIRFAFDLGIEQNFLEEVTKVIVGLYQEDFPELSGKKDQVIAVLVREEKLFRHTLKKGLAEFEKMYPQSQEKKPMSVLDGAAIFKLHDTYGFPSELVIEEAYKRGVEVSPDWRPQFDSKMEEQRSRSRTATKGEFKGGLADHSEINTKYHTATHLMYKALRIVLGDHVIQRGSNITAERLRFDFSHTDKMTPEQIKSVEDIVNEQIGKDWPMSWREEDTREALASGVVGAFGDRYGERVKVYTVGDPDGEYFSREICGGPHVEHTGQLAEGGKKFKILKEESSSAGVRRIKAVLI
jgi:alanyl-tRNA synthetase